MKSLKDISLKNKLIGIILLVTVFAFSISFVVYITLTASTLKANLLNSMVVNAKVIGEYSVSPIVFEDKNGGYDVLRRVSTIDEIEEALLFDNKGNVFAEYQKKGGNLIVPQYRTVEFSEYRDDFLFVYQPIVYLNANYGSVYLKISTQHLYEKLNEQIRWILLFGLVTLLISYLLAYRLQKIISQPIIDLTSTADKISERKDFSLRIESGSSDEIGVLYDRFNNMVEQIERHQERQKKNQVALSMSEEKYRNIFQNSMIGIYRQSLESRVILDMNEAAAQILGLTTHSVKQNAPTKLFAKVTDRNKFVKMLKSDGRVNNFEAQVTKIDGSLIWVSVSGRIIEDGIYEGVIQDITVGKENYLNLQKANFELDNFVYHTSHDLRSPLLSVLGLVNIANQETDLDQLRILLGMIDKSIRKLDSLVNDLLILSRDNRINDPLSVIDIEALINESISNYDFIEGFKEIDIRIQVNGDTILTADRTRVNVLLNNLISNAIKYRRKNIKKSHIEISVDIDNYNCTITISDNGEGIKDEYQKQIFDMFFRATENSEGSGLGLYIVKNVVEKLEGEITFTSQYGEGTTFTTRFPNHTRIKEEVEKLTA